MPAPCLRPLLGPALVVGTVLGCFGVYLWSPGVPQVFDSYYSLLVSESLLTHGTTRLDDVLPADHGRLPGARPWCHLPYQLVELPNRGTYYGYPLGSSIASLPMVAVLRSGVGLSTLGPDGRYVPGHEVRLQRVLAAAVTAVTVGLVLLMARGPLSWGPSLLVAFAFAFASPAWSTLSRGLWSQTWLALWLAAVVVVLGWMERTGPLSGRTARGVGILLGSLLFWAVFTRPQGAISAVAVGAYLLWRDRRALAATIVAGAAWVALLVAWSEHVFGQALPPSLYGSDGFDGRAPLARLVGLLISPSRGLLVYCPVLLVLVGLLIVRWRHVTGRRLLLPIGLAVGGELVLLMSFRGWHGGFSYGPRYFCDVLPWFALFAVLAVKRVAGEESTKYEVRSTKSTQGAAPYSSYLVPRTSYSLLPPPLYSALLSVCLLWGLFVHARGAMAPQAFLWNLHLPLADDAGCVAAVNDWHCPQFLCGITFTVGPDGRIIKVPTRKRWAALWRVGPRPER